MAVTKLPTCIEGSFAHRVKMKAQMMRGPKVVRYVREGTLYAYLEGQIGLSDGVPKSKDVPLDTVEVLW